MAKTRFLFTTFSFYTSVRENDEKQGENAAACTDIVLTFLHYINLSFLLRDLMYSELPLVVGF